MKKLMIGFAGGDKLHVPMENAAFASGKIGEDNMEKVIQLLKDGKTVIFLDRVNAVWPLAEAEDDD